MTIQEMINRVNIQMPHQYLDDMLLGWVNELEKDIADFLSMYEEEYDPTHHQSMDEELQIDEPQIYVPYVIAQICLANEEYDRYNNHFAVFYSKYQDWKDKYIRKHMPVCKGKVIL